MKKKKWDKERGEVEVTDVENETDERG